MARDSMFRSVCVCAAAIYDSRRTGLPNLLAL